MGSLYINHLLNATGGTTKQNRIAHDIGPTMCQFQWLGFVSVPFT